MLQCYLVKQAVLCCFFIDEKVKLHFFSFSKNCFLLCIRNMFYIQPRLFDSIITMSKYLSVLQIALFSAHLCEAHSFLGNHSEIVNFLREEYSYRPFSICFILDSAILLLTMVSYLMKRELNNCQYLTDVENLVYLIATITLLVCSLGYLTCLVLFYQWSSFLSGQFSQKMEKEMAEYPCGAMKPVIDRIQMKYGCCGVISHEDWFASNWVEQPCPTKCSSENSECSNASTDSHAINANKLNTSDDVPFSCCSNAIGIPCIHHKLHQNSHYVVFNQLNSTIWDIGCIAKFNAIYLTELKSLTVLAISITTFSILMALVDKAIQATDNTFSKNGTLCFGFFALDITDELNYSQQGSTSMEINDVTNFEEARKMNSKIAESIPKTDAACKHVLSEYSSRLSSPRNEFTDFNGSVKIMANFKQSNGSNFPDELIRRSSRSFPSRASWSSSDRKRKSSTNVELSGKRMKGLLF